MQLEGKIYLSSFFLKGELYMSDITSWQPKTEEEAQRASVKSADSVPDVQDPLGSSVMTPDDT